jgi:hypothetical protein
MNEQINNLLYGVGEVTTQFEGLTTEKPQEEPKVEQPKEYVIGEYYYKKGTYAGLDTYDDWETDDKGIKRKVTRTAHKFEIPRNWRAMDKAIIAAMEEKGEEIPEEMKPKAPRMTYKMSNERATLLETFLATMKAHGTVYKTKAGKYAVEIDDSWFTYGLTENKKAQEGETLDEIPTKTAKEKLLAEMLTAMESYKDGEWLKVKTGIAFTSGGKWFTVTLTANRKEPADKKAI